MTNVPDATEQTLDKLETIVAPDNGTVDEVLSAVLECANAWVPEARIVGNVRAGDISRAVSSALAERNRHAGTGVQVKPLEWEHLGGDFYRAQSPLFGNIRIEWFGEHFTVAYSVPGYTNTFTGGNFETADAAKAAAQADYEARILSALSHPAPQAETQVNAGAVIGAEEILIRLVELTASYCHGAPEYWNPKDARVLIEMAKLMTPCTEAAGANLYKLRAALRATPDEADAMGTAPVLFGLEAQGHIPTIERMLANVESWGAIAKAINWDAETARSHYHRYRDRRAALRSTPTTEGGEANG